MVSNNGSNLSHSDCMLSEVLSANPKLDLKIATAGQKPIAAIFILIGLLGIAFNISVIITLRKKPLSDRVRENLSNLSSFNTLLTNLAVADLLAAIAVTLIGVKTIYIIVAAEDSYNENKKAPSNIKDLITGSNGICKISYLFFFLTNFVSILTATSMAVGSYRGIVIGSMRRAGSTRLSRKKMALLLTVIWCTAIASSIPTYYIVEVTPAVYNRCFFTHHLPNGFSTFNLAFTIFITAIFYFTPAFVMMFCYIRIDRELKKHSQLKLQTLATTSSTRFSNGAEQQKYQNSNKKAQKPAVVLSIIVAAIFLITMLPFMVYLWVIAISKCNADEILQIVLVDRSHLWILFEVAHILYVMPPLVNPICYSFCIPSFQRKFKEMCGEFNEEDS
ncbi:Neuropeptide Y receptor type 1 [Trichoplax sp. H2]|nr:Neuropeptide Y receptor type 1 [Trichoplax sp. H2]|eukprot:RDD38744.1 Neuropeptide Y receptor type 1 [Trichoplax sp. H2]